MSGYLPAHTLRKHTESLQRRHRHLSSVFIRAEQKLSSLYIWLVTVIDSFSSIQQRYRGSSTYSRLRIMVLSALVRASLCLSKSDTVFTLLTLHDTVLAVFSVVLKGRSTQITLLALWIALSTADEPPLMSVVFMLADEVFIFATPHLLGAAFFF